MSRSRKNVGASGSAASREGRHDDFSVFSYAAMLLLLPVTAFRVWSWVLRAGSSKVWDYGPAQFAFAVHQVAEGNSLYRDFRSPPYLPFPYGPVVPYTAALLSRFLGSDAMAALKAGRALTMTATVAVCVFIYLLSRRAAASRAAASIAAVAFALSPMLEPWGFEFRVDMPALAFELAGLYLFSLGRQYCALAAFVAGFFTKASCFAGIVAVALWCWFAGARSKGLGLLGAWAGIVLVINGVLQALFPYYLLNTFKALSPLYSSVEFALLFPGAAVVSNWGIVILAATGMAEPFRGRGLPRLFLLVAALQGVVACMKWGSNLYYFLPALAGATIVSANGIDVLMRLAARLPKVGRAWSGGIVALGLLAQLYVVSVWYGGDGFPTVSQLARTGLKCCYISDPRDPDPAALRLLRKMDGPVLTDAPELLLADERKSVWFIELFLITGMRLRGIFDDGRLLGDIRQQRIAALALDGELLGRQWGGVECFWPELREAIVANYYLVPSIGPPYIALPRGKAVP